MAKKRDDDLAKDQCGVCGDYCFSYPPIPWKLLFPAGSEPVQACSSCFERYSGSSVPNPRKDFVQRRLYRALAVAEREAARIEEELAAIDEV